VNQIKSFADVLLVLEELEKESSYNKKVTILQRVYSNKDLELVFYYTYDVSVNFFARVPEFDGHVSTVNLPESDIENRWKQWQLLAQKLMSRGIVGNNARMELKAFLDTCTPLEQKWYTRIINRELRIGVSETLIKRFWPKLLPPIHPMLATMISDVSTIKFPVYVEPKYDGVRVLTFVQDGIVQCFTRNGKRLPRLEELLMSNCKLKDNVFIDSEYFLGTWNTTTSQLFNQSSNLKESKFYAFDIVDLNTYMRKGHTPPIEVRKQQLSEYLDSCKCPYFNKVPSHIANDMDSVQEKFKMFISQKQEGAIIKIAGSPYEFKRSKNWLKMKEQDYATYLCIDILPGTGKYLHSLGSIIVRGHGQEFKVGSGFTDEQRTYYWSHKNEIIGKCVEVATFPSTAKSSKGSFPVFVRVREDVSC